MRLLSLPHFHKSIKFEAAVMEIFEEFHIKMSFWMKKGLKFGYLLQVDFKEFLNSFGEN